MKEKKILLETAKLAKEIRFDWPVDHHYTEYLAENVHPEDGTTGPFGWEKGEVEENSGYFINHVKETDLSNDHYACYARPTQSYLKDFLRDIYHLDVVVFADAFGWTWVVRTSYYPTCISAGYEILCNENEGPNFNGEWENFHEAMEYGLQKTLEYIKTNNIKKS